MWQMCRVLLWISKLPRSVLYILVQLKIEKNSFDLFWFFILLECGCNVKGTEKGDPTCNNKDGKCNCKCDVSGDKCDTCELGHQGFPDCHGNF